MAAITSTKASVTINGIALPNSGTINSTQVTELIESERETYPGSGATLYILKIRTSGGGEIIWRYDTAAERTTDKNTITAAM